LSSASLTGSLSTSILSATALSGTLLLALTLSAEVLLSAQALSAALSPLASETLAAVGTSPSGSTGDSVEFGLSQEFGFVGHPSAGELRRESAEVVMRASHQLLQHLSRSRVSRLLQDLPQVNDVHFLDLGPDFQRIRRTSHAAGDEGVIQTLVFGKRKHARNILDPVGRAAPA